MSSISPPSPQEIQRKLSLHTSVSPGRNIRASKPSLATGHVSGTESDSDSILTPDVASGQQSASMFHGGSVGGSQPPLSSIAERRSASGDETEDEDEPADSGWRTPDNRTKPTNSGEERILKSGYLWKKGERRKTWKKRWFVLRPAHLAYYKTSAEYQLLRLLDLADIHSCTPVSLKRHHYTFGLISPNRTFYFQAPSEQEMREWVEAIEEARSALLATSTQNSVSETPTPMGIGMGAPGGVSGSGGGAHPIPIVRSTSEQRAAHAIQQQLAHTPGSAARGSQAGLSISTGFSLSSSPGNQLNVVTSSDSEDGGISLGMGGSHSVQGVADPTPSMKITQSAPSPTAVTFSFPQTPALKAAATTLGGTTSSGGSSAGSKVVLSGYLMKCGSKRRTWRKRWFVLTEEKLMYSGSHMETKPHRVFPFSEILDALEYELPASSSTKHHHVHHHIPGASLASNLSSSRTATSLTAASAPAAPGSENIMPMVEGAGDGTTHTFKIVTTKRNLLLCAPSEEDEIKWLGAIRALIARRSGTGVVPGVKGTTARGLGVIAGAAGAVGGAPTPGSVVPNVDAGLGLGTSPPQSQTTIQAKTKARRPSASAGSDVNVGSS